MEIPKDKESVISLRTTNGELELRQSKARIYSFMGHYAMSHIFIESEEQEKDGTTLGYFLFLDQLGPDEPAQIETFQQILSYGLQGGFEMHLNIQHPSESDIDAYTNHVLGDLDNGDIPQS